MALLIADLNDLDVMACDVGNAYLNAPFREKIWFAAGQEHGERYGKVMFVIRDFYGLKSSRASRIAIFAATLDEMVFVPTQANTDVYRRRTKKANGEEYYKLLLIYVDNVLDFSHAPKLIMDNLALTYELKEGSVGEPTIHLGAKIKKYQVKSGKSLCSMPSTQYVKNKTRTVEGMLKEDGRTLRNTKASGKQPLTSIYQLEMEQSEELNPELASWYLQLIGILRWAVELGRIDIFTETAIMSQYPESPR